MLTGPSASRSEIEIDLGQLYPEIDRFERQRLFRRGQSFESPTVFHSPIMFGAHLIGIYEYDVLNCRERLVETQLRPAIVVHRRWRKHLDDDDPALVARGRA